jgi:hypothetical protein
MELIREVDPARLAWGSYDHKAGQYIGEGDICASYSGDCIATGQPVRKPFRRECELWLTVGISGFGDLTHRATASAYRLLPVRLSKHTPLTYEAKTGPDQGEAARNDPLGFYDRVTVKHGGQAFVLCGPEVQFVAGEPQQAEVQLDLFRTSEAL